jgi:predicted nucleotidyltransferase
MASLDIKIRQRALAALDLLNQLGSVRAAYVFGSQVDGRSDQWSDIDIAAFMDGIESWDMVQRARMMARLQREISSDLEAHLFSTKSMLKPESGSFADYILKTGVCIYPQQD